MFPRMPLLAVLVACRDPEEVTVGGRTASLVVDLVNPTECAGCDPWEDLDHLVLEARSDGQTVASIEAAPGETLALPSVDGFGVVEIRLLGYADGRVRSAGRTREVVLGPDVETRVPMVFLPVNRALPLTTRMQVARARHLARRMRDGSVLLLGGTDPDGLRSLSGVERFDPVAWAFTAEDTPLAAGAADLVAIEVEDGDVLVAGGEARTRQGTVALPDSFLVDIETGVRTAQGTMEVGRVGHCVARWKERQAIVLGGAAGDVADYLKPVEGRWTFEPVPMRDFDPSKVTGCVPVAGERVLVLGEDAASSGLWAPTEDGDPGASFTPHADGVEGPKVRRAMVVPTGAGDAWIAGGVRVDDDVAVASTHRFDAAAGTFEPSRALGAPRVDGRWARWTDPDVVVVGCGYGDSARSEAGAAAELVAPRSGTRLASIPMDRARAGCALTVLLDGTVLFTGGTTQGAAAGAATAAIAVPWFADEAAGGGDSGG
jgi:hypothetical protein